MSRAQKPTKFIDKTTTILIYLILYGTCLTLKLKNENHVKAAAKVLSIVMKRTLKAVIYNVTSKFTGPVTCMICKNACNTPGGF